MKQLQFFEQEEQEGESKNIYTSKIKAPIYEPVGQQPDIFALVDKSKVSKMIRDIDQSSLPEKEKKFLKIAATRHYRFDYETVANYYAHASKEMQELMERSGLVIIDFEDAIRYGYIKYTEEIGKLYAKENNIKDED